MSYSFSNTPEGDELENRNGPGITISVSFKINGDESHQDGLHLSWICSRDLLELVIMFFFILSC